MDPISLLESVVPGLISYLPMTLLYWFVPSVIALALGTGLCIARLSRNRIAYGLSTLVISFFRGTPSLVQLYLVFFGLPKILELVGVDANDWPAGTFFILAGSLNLSCFVAETLRGGYLGVDRGQIETGLSIGYSRWQNFWLVIAPQTLKVSILNLKNLSIDVVKDTSVAYTIGATEMMAYANRMITANSGIGQLWILGAAAVIYFILCAILEAVFTKASNWMERYEKRIPA